MLWKADIWLFTIMALKMKSSAAGYITVTCPHARVQYSLEQADYII